GRTAYEAQIPCARESSHTSNHSGEEVSYASLSIATALQRDSTGFLGMMARDGSRAPAHRPQDPGPRAHRALLPGRPRAPDRVPARGHALPRDAWRAGPPQLRRDPADVRPCGRRPRPLRPPFPARRVEEGLRARQAGGRQGHGPAKRDVDLRRRPERLHRRALLRLTRLLTGPGGGVSSTPRSAQPPRPVAG